LASEIFYLLTNLTKRYKLGEMQVNVDEAKTQLSRLLELVERGENVTIARHGSL